MRGKVDKLAWLLLAAWLVSSSGAVSSAHAQPSEVQAARAAYLRATAAAEELRWSDALQDFREAYTLSGAPPALLNVGLALRALGRYVEARDTFELLLGAEPEYAREQNVSELLDHARTQIAQISVEGLAGSNQIRLNGRPVAPDAPGTTRVLLVDPGLHTVEVVREGFLPVAWEGRLDGGAVACVRVSYRAVIHDDSSRTRRTRRIVGGLSVLVVAAAVLGVVFLQRGAQLEPATDNHLRFP